MNFMRTIEASIERVTLSIDSTEVIPRFTRFRPTPRRADGQAIRKRRDIKPRRASFAAPLPFLSPPCAGRIMAGRRGRSEKFHSWIIDMKTSDYLALDLGAESGRGLLGRFDGERLTLDELHRFPNGPVKMLDTLHWDAPRLFEEMKTALRKAVAVGAELNAVGIDTWGVDFGLVGRNDTLLGNPVHYRDDRTKGMMDAAFARISKERIYEITGLQFLPFNTVYQLLALRLAKSPLLDVAETLLMMPDLFAWLFTGRRAGERTDASTTQLLDPRNGDGPRGVRRARPALRDLA